MKDKYVKPIALRVDFDNDVIVTSNPVVCEEDEMNVKDKKTGELVTIAYGNDGVWNYF